MAPDSDESIELRRARRARWPITRHRLGEEPSDDLSAVTTPVERIAMMWTLAQAAWTPEPSREALQGRHAAARRR
jgi:hypothetical protein